MLLNLFSFWREVKESGRDKLQTWDLNESKSWMRWTTWDTAYITCCSLCYWNSNAQGSSFCRWLTLDQQLQKRAWKGCDKQQRGREKAPGRTASLRRPVILLHSVTILEICLTAHLLWLSKCFEKVTKYWCVLKHEELRTLLHQTSSNFVLLLWRT